MHIGRYTKRALGPLAICVSAGAALSFANVANASCSSYEPAKAAVRWGEGSPYQARFMRTSLQEQAAPATATNDPHSIYAIVGLWKIKLTAKGNEHIKDGTPIDFGYQTWHDDGTEILNSGGRAPLTSSFCMGVWERVSYHHYKLNHVTLSWDATGQVFVGPGNIKEDVEADESGMHYSGTFEIIQYATDEKTILADIKGVVTGDRITVE
jgi:hypothetical protein